MLDAGWESLGGWLCTYHGEEFESKGLTKLLRRVSWTGRVAVPRDMVAPLIW